MSEINNQKPCFVQTSQGFSVSYNNQLLYSKYNPSKVIIQTINNLQILPGTIFLCISPVLGYGLEELLSKIPEDCLVFLIEADSALLDFAKSSINCEKYQQKIQFVMPDDLKNLPLMIYDLARSGKYKRVKRIDFSAGVKFFASFYDELTLTCSNSIMTYWKNRVTLTKFGRRYSYNFFSNLSVLSQTVPISNYFQKISKPVLIFGAGQSIDSFLQTNSLNFQDFFIICVDTALQPLLTRKIIPDAVFIEEAQSVILKAFIGFNDNLKTQIFAGLSSIPYLKNFVSPSKISFFTTEFTKANFLSRFSQFSFLPPLNNPFGSVGLTAVYYALKFRADESVPIFICGLDFSFSKGFTHAKNTLAYTTRILNHNRLCCIENFNACFGQNIIEITDKKGKTFYTSIVLKSYADLFISLFNDKKNVFDAGECGMNLNLPCMNIYEMQKFCSQFLEKTFNIQKNSLDFKFSSFTENQKNELKSALENEKKELLKLKKLLSMECGLSKEELQKKITKIASQTDYLFLHFPDGHQFVYEQSFLNRIRNEIDFFLKVI